MRWISLLTISFMLSFSVAAQKFVFDGQLSDFDNQKRIGGVTVAAFSEGKEILKMTTGNNGKYSMELPIDKKYQIRFTKSGYVIKTMTIDALGILEEDLPIGGQIMPAVDIELFSERPGVDFSFMNTEPVVVWQYNNRKLIMDWDKKVVMEMKEKIDALLKEAEEKNQKYETEYTTLIKDANLLYRDGKYQEALDKYTAAIKIPGKERETHPNARVMEIDDILSKQAKEALVAQQADQEYQNLIQAAENFKDQGKFENAIQRFNEASLKKPTEQYPKDQVKELQEKINETKRRGEFDALVTAGDELLKNDKLEDAKKKFEAATKILPSETHPKEQLKLIDVRIKEAAESLAKKKKYDEAIQLADILFSENKYPAAIAKYKEAQQVDSENKYPGNQIALAEQKLQELVNAQKEEQRYQVALKAGDDAFKEKAYDKAKDAYNEALKVKKGEAYPTGQLQKIEKIKADEAALAIKIEKIEGLLTAALKNHANGDYKEAVTKYDEILAMDPTNTPAMTGKKESEKALAAIKEVEVQQAKFNALVKDADALFQSSSFEQARQKYQEAEKVIPNNAHVTERLKLVEVKLKELQESAALEQQINNLLTAAKLAEDKEKLEEAEQKFKDVLALDNGNKVAADGLSRIEDKRKQAAEEAKAKEAEAAAAQAKKDDLLATAKTAEDNQDWDKAINSYQEFLATDKNNVAVKTKLKQAETSKKKAEEQELEASFQKLKKEADDLFSQGELNAAEQKYKEAKQIKPSSEIDLKITEVQQESAKLASAADREKNFNKLIAEADELFSKENYPKALETYEKALVYKDEDAHAKQRVQTINDKFLDAFDRGMLAFAEKDYANAIKFFDDALEVNPLSQKVQQKRKIARTELDKLLSAEENYSKLMDEAEKKYAEEDLLGAKKIYQEAQKIKPQESSPQLAIVKIDEALRKKQEDQTAVEKEVTELIKQSDDLSKKGEFKKAIELVEKAETLKPSVTNQQKIEKLQQKQAELEKEEKFNDLVTQAKQAFDGGELEKSKNLYEEALGIKEDPKLRTAIKGIDSKLNEPEQEVVVIDNTQELLASAKQAYNNSDYEKAKTLYTAAQKQNPNDPTIAERINEIDSKISAIALEKQQDAARQKSTEEAKIKGDEKLAQGEFLQARDEYEKGLELDPSNLELRQKVKEAIEMAKNKATSSNEQQYQKIIEKADELFDSESYERSKKLYERALTFRNYDQYPKDRIDEIRKILSGPVKKDVELAYLGEDEELSLLEAAALLEQAERQRQALQKQRVSDRQQLSDEQRQKLEEIELLNRRSFQEEITQIEKERTRNYLENNIAKGQDIFVSLEDEIKALEEKRLQEQAFERGAILRQNESIRFMLDNFTENQEEASGKNLLLADEIVAIQEAELKQQQVRNNSLNEQRKRNTEYMDALQDDLRVDTDRAKERRDFNQEQLRTIAEEQELPHESSTKHLDNASEIDGIQRTELESQATRALELQEQRKLNTAYMEELQDDLQADTERSKKRRDFNQELLRIIAEEQEQPHSSSEKHLANANEVDAIQLKSLEAQKERDAQFEEERKLRTLQMEKLSDDIAADRTKSSDRTAYNQRKVTRIQELQEVSHESSEKHLANADELDDIQLKAMELQLDRDADAQKQRKQATKYMDRLKDEIKEDTERAKERRDFNQAELTKIAADQEIAHASVTKHLDNAVQIDEVRDRSLTDQEARDAKMQEQRKVTTAYMEDLSEDLREDTDRAVQRRAQNFVEVTRISEEQEQPHKGAQTHLANADEVDGIQAKASEELRDRNAQMSEERKETTTYMNQLSDDLKADVSRATEMRNANDAQVREQLSYQERQLLLDAEDSYNKLQSIQYQATMAELKKAEIQADKKLVQQQVEDDLRFLIDQSTRNNQEEVLAKRADLLRADQTLVAAQEQHKETTAFKDLSREKTIAKVDDINKISEIERRQANQDNKAKVQTNADRVQTIQRMNEEQLLAMDEDLTDLRNLLEDQVVALEDKIRARDDQKIQQRQTVVADLEKTKVDAETERREKETVAKDNHAVIDAVSAMKDMEETQRKEALKAQKQRRQELLDGLESGNIKFTETIANSLGDEFPEGVSQETFVKNDKDGLPIQVITRRIVVMESKGDVYLRMQSKRGITYSKNGQPISEQAWLKGTESGKLQRHF